MPLEGIPKKVETRGRKKKNATPAGSSNSNPIHSPHVQSPQSTNSQLTTLQKGHSFKTWFPELFLCMTCESVESGTSPATVHKPAPPSGIAKGGTQQYGKGGGSQNEGSLYGQDFGHRLCELEEHFKKTGHCLALSAKYKKYCFYCEDFVYTSCEFQKRRYGSSVKDIREIREGAADNINHLNLGVRGLNNLGNTCFMNSILQAFAHNPLFRNYFLDDHHNPEICAEKRQENRDVCLGCEMDEIISAFFGGDLKPFTPHSLLYAMWQHSTDFVGYQQQDAHEFAIAALNGLHSHSFEKQLTNCPCLVHQNFQGVLSSKITCSDCGMISTTTDPFFDISLDIPNIEGIVSLLDCLSRFTSKESLVDQEKFFCRGCGALRESTKQMSIRALPNSLSFQIKRFNQDQNGKNKRFKVDTFVKFPETIDMSPYLSFPTESRSATPATSGANGGNAQTGFGEEISPLQATNNAESDQKHNATMATGTSLLQIETPQSTFSPETSNHLSNGNGNTSSNSSSNSSQGSSSIENTQKNGQSNSDNKRRSISDESSTSSNEDALAEKNGSQEESVCLLSGSEVNRANVTATSAMFSVYAVVCHFGSLDSGHYVAFIKNANSWFKCDDAVVTLVDPETVFDANAYLVFYLRNEVAVKIRG